MCLEYCDGSSNGELYLSNETIITVYPENRPACRGSSGHARCEMSAREISFWILITMAIVLSLIIMSGILAICVVIIAIKRRRAEPTEEVMSCP